MSRGWIRFAVLAVVVAVAVVLVIVGLPAPRTMNGRGVGAVLAYVAIYALATLLPVPKAVFSLAAGVLFGIAGGIVVTLVGATGGAVVAFALARGLGRVPVERYGGVRLEWLDQRLTGHGLVAVLGLRLVPLVPFTVLNYAAGLTGVSWSAYVLGTALGVAPGATLYVVLGASGHEPGSWPFLLALGAAAAFLLTGSLVLRRRAGVATSSADE